MNQRVKGTKQWALTLWCWAISLIMLIFREDWPAVVILANWFVVVGSLFLLSGISEYHFTKGIPKWISIVISLLMFYGFYYYAEVNSDDTKRVLLLISFSALVKFAALYFLIPTIKRFTAVGTVMAIGFAVHGLFFTYHAFLGMWSPATFTDIQLQHTTIQLMIEVFLFMLWFTVSATMLTNVVLQRDLKRLAYRDTLTGVLNRRSVLETTELSLIKFEGSNFSLLVLDIDKFKKINDKFGHAAGDNTLQSFTATVSKQLRDFDIFGRLGGEEFLIALPRTGADQAALIAQRICSAVMQNPVEFGGQLIQYTVSIGINSITAKENSDLSELVMQADNAMYRAKSTGRNKFEVYQNF